MGDGDDHRETGEVDGQGRQRAMVRQAEDRAEHARQHHRLSQARALRHHAKRIALKALQLILAHRKNLSIHFISNFNWNNNRTHRRILDSKRGRWPTDFFKRNILSITTRD